MEVFFDAKKPVERMGKSVNVLNWFQQRVAFVEAYYEMLRLQTGLFQKLRGEQARWAT
jgi:hypothetical protein